MHILLTGTDGYIGAVMQPYLRDRGHAVTGLDTGFYRDGWLDPAVPQTVAPLQRDTRDITLADLEGFDAVVHLAELSNDPLGEHNPELTFQINHLASVRLAALAKEAGIDRFVYASSCSVYGAGSADIVSEESPTNPQTAYAECKLLVERDVAALADDRFAPTFLRNATAFGPSPRMRLDIVLNNLAALAWTTREIRMISDGTPWRPLVHILDISQAVACVLEAPRSAVANQIFNVGDSRQNYRVREIAQIVAEVFPGCELTLGSNGGDTRSYRVSFEKINAQVPGFRCRYDAHSGAEQLRKLFERIGFSADDFDFRAYTRLRQLRYLLETSQIDDTFRWRNI